MHDVHVRLLGSFAVSVDGVLLPADAWPQRRAADLVKLLALTPGRRLPRDRVLDALWPHLDPPAAAAALHKAAHYARRTLGEREALVVSGGVVALAPAARVATDVERFEAGDGDAAGELLPDDVYEEWTVQPRQRLRDLALARLREAGRWRDVLALDPADEEAHREIMRECALAGDRAGAVRQYRRLTKALAPLGARPAADSIRLFRDIARGPAVVAARGHDEPLLGRPNEVALVRDRVATARDGHGGVLMLTGPPGAGKTRLAEIALAHAEEQRWHTLRGSAEGLAGAPLGPLRAAAADLEQQRPDLRAHVSETAARVLDDPDGHAAADVAAAYSELFAGAADERGCVVVLDDLQHADEGTIDALQRLGKRAAGRPLLVVAAWRDEEARPRLRTIAAGLEACRHGSELALRPVEATGPPATRYAVTADGARIAFQVVGDGPGPPVVLVPGWVSNVEYTWEMPVARRMFQRLAARSKVVLWDKRGTGLSDPVAEVPTMDERILDLTAVIEAAACERAVLFGVSEGGPMGIRFAVEKPELVAGLVLYNSTPRFYRGDDWPFGWSPEIATQIAERLHQSWGTGALLSIWAPSLADDPASRELFGRFQRAGASPAMGRAMAYALRTIDVRHLLADVRVPTLVAHRTGDRLISVESSRYTADRIPGAVLVEMPGTDHFPFTGDMDAVIDEIEEFLSALGTEPLTGAGRSSRPAS